MKIASVDIRFEGDKFLPSKLKSLTNLPIEALAEYGEISRKGRYKGQPSPYGIGILNIFSTDSKNNVYDLIKQYTLSLLERKSELKKSGVEEIIFDIEAPKDYPTELILDTDLLKQLITLNARVDFHTLSDTEYTDELFKKYVEIITLIEKEKKYADSYREEISKNAFFRHPIFSKSWDKMIYYLIFKEMIKRKRDDNSEETLIEFENLYKKLNKEHKD